MKKKILSSLLCLTLLCAACPTALADYDNFTAVRSYTQGQFTDVSASAWYASNVEKCYEYGLIDGKSVTSYAPDGNLTLGEAVKLAAVLHSRYTTGKSEFAASTPWYKTYVDYALDNGILSAAFANYNASATRAQFATIFAAALPDSAFTAVNDVEDGAIPDVATGTLYSAAVYKLYRAGVLTGSDETGAFRPTTAIRRSEVAAITSRMIDKKLRLSVTLLKDDKSALSAEQVFRICSPAVFYIEVYDASGTATASGSGVFLSSEGKALTNYHVINGAHSAKIKTSDGKYYTVSGVYDYDADRDLALIKVSGSGFDTLTTSSAALSTGATVYAIGSPLGLDNSISAGIISSASREVEGMEYIQTTASISHGSSGGALINTNGELIGITSAYIDGGQNLNLAIPIENLSALSDATLTSLSKVVSEGYSNAATYSGMYPAPDFGAFSGAPLIKSSKENGVNYFYYRSSDIKVSAVEAVDGYASLLEKNGFAFASYSTNGGLISRTYFNSSYGMALVFGATNVQNEEYVVIAIYST